MKFLKLFLGFYFIFFLPLFGGEKVRDNKINLTQDEIAWLATNPVLKFAVDPKWSPIENINKENIYEGMNADLLAKISEISGIKFQLVPTKEWPESVELSKNGKVDMLPCISKTPEREGYLNFSQTTIALNDGIFMRSDATFIDDVEDLKGFKVGVPDGTALHTLIKEKYPLLIVIPIKGTQLGIEMLADGKIDAYAGNLEVGGFVLQQLGFFNLKVVFKFPEKRYMHIGLQKTFPAEALSIINKTLKSISVEEIETIRQRWVGLRIAEDTNYELMYKIGAGFVIFMILAMYSNSKLKQMISVKTAEINRKKEELELLVGTFDKNVIYSKTDLKGNITHVSEAFCTISGYTKEELIGKPHNIVRHPDTDKEFFHFLWENLRKGACVKADIKNLAKNGTTYWVDGKFEPEYDLSGKHIGYSAIRSDITGKKEVEELKQNLEKLVDERTEELEKEKENVEQILANILLPVLITSKERRIVVYANRFAQELYEMEEDKMVNAFLDNIYTLKNGPARIIEQLQAKGKVDALEEHIYTHTGKNFIGLLSVVPIEYNNEACYIGMTVDITKQKDMENEVRAIHKHTRESIEYASLIQHAIIPSNELFRKYFSDYLVIWHPKDIVGGDIYLFEELRHEDECLLMVIDCTGHGVPGAFVSMLVKAIERQIIANILHNEDEVISPSKILTIFNRNMKHLLKQEHDDSISNAGFDGGVIYYNKKENILKFAGAEIPLFYVEDGEFKTIKGDRHSVGYKKSDKNFEFKEHHIKTKKGMSFYLATDGYLDQNGGEKGFPFGKKRFGEIVATSHSESCADQQEIFLDALHEYQKNEDRNDDVTVVGIKI